jgi:hypothetical protein
MDRRLGGKQPTKYEFKGEHENLVTGRFYTLREVSEIIGVNNTTIHSRMRNKPFLTDREVSGTESQYYYVGNGVVAQEHVHRLETHEQKMSDAWLRKKLT